MLSMLKYTKDENKFLLQKQRIKSKIELNGKAVTNFNSEINV